MKMLRPWATMLALLAIVPVRADEPPPLTVFAAASLTNALQDIGDEFMKQTATPVRFSFAASSVLARQIESGAKADIFFGADAEWMDYLQARELIDRRSRRDVLGNRLVLIAPADSRVTLTIRPGFALAGALGSGRLAAADPDSVPAGRYARSALTALGLWNDIQDRLIRAENVRSAMLFVSRHEAPLGIVYETDALVDKGVRVVDVFPPSSHPPIVYPVALTRTARPAAAGFMAYLSSPAGDAIFIKYGFKTLR